MTICYRVDLSEAERTELQGMLSGGKQAACKLKRAQILLAANAGVPDETIAQSIAVGGSTVYPNCRISAEMSGTTAMSWTRMPMRAAVSDFFMNDGP